MIFINHITIISTDICLTNKIISCINKIIKSPIITIYNPTTFKDDILTRIKNKEPNIYLIDIYELETEFLEITNLIKKINDLNKIGIIAINKNLNNIIETQKNIDFTIIKDGNFYKNLKQNIIKILKKQDTKKLIISNKNINIILNKNTINDIYQFTNNKISINYKNYNNSILISNKNITSQLHQITNNEFYTKNKEVTKRKYYTESLKQLLVDLYLIFKIDINTLSKHFQVEAKYIKKWSTLSKYNRKINIPFKILGKIIIKSYLKK